ncbi:MAG: NAD-binding protein [Gudongella sp.]|nr:NAD-binding protein [Gudongella sp.]
MEVLAVGSIIALMVLGYFLMDRIGMFFVENNEIIQKKPEDRRTILIYLDNESDKELFQLFENMKFSYYLIYDSNIPEKIEFRTFFAISHDDAENLFLCRQVRKKSKNTWIVARINDYIYADIYRKIGVNKVIVGDITQDRIVESLQGVTFNG